jgi:hypothetical protein
MLADKKSGEFSLQIISISLYGEQLSTPKIQEKHKEWILETIQDGVPLYNKGEMEECGMLYRATLDRISLDFEDTEWFHHHFAQAPTSEAAWWYRHMLDQLTQTL